MTEETTEGKAVLETLRMIVGWLEKGTEIEYRYIDSDAWLPYHGEGMSVHPRSCIYHAKPRKPRTGQFCNPGCIPFSAQVVELTPEVRAVLEREGLLP